MAPPSITTTSNAPITTIAINDVLIEITRLYHLRKDITAVVSGAMALG